MEEIACPAITSADGIIEAHEGWERPPTPEMMEVRYELYDGMSGKEIEDQLDAQSSHQDPNTVREDQIEQLEGLITGLNFWPAAVEVFQQRQSALAAEINYTGHRKKHSRRDLETILSDCHAQIRDKRERPDE